MGPPIALILGHVQLSCESFSLLRVTMHYYQNLRQIIQQNKDKIKQ